MNIDLSEIMQQLYRDDGKVGMICDWDAGTWIGAETGIHCSEKINLKCLKLKNQTEVWEWYVEMQGGKYQKNQLRV